MIWRYEPDRVARILEEAGLDVDRSAARLPGGGSVVGRRDRGGAVVLVAVDAGGRIRITLTTSLRQPTADTHQVGNLGLRRVVEETRQETLTGRVESVETLADILHGILGEEPAPPRGDGTGGPW